MVDFPASYVSSPECSWLTYWWCFFSKKMPGWFRSRLTRGTTWLNVSIYIYMFHINSLSPFIKSRLPSCSLNPNQGRGCWLAFNVGFLTKVPGCWTNTSVAPQGNVEWHLGRWSNWWFARDKSRWRSASRWPLSKYPPKDDEDGESGGWIFDLKKWVKRNSTRGSSFV